MLKKNSTYDYEPVSNPSTRLTNAAESKSARDTQILNRRRNKTEQVKSPAERELINETFARPPRDVFTPLPFGSDIARRWKLKRGHAFSFAGLCLFIFVTYFRPQEYFHGFEATQLALVCAIITLAVFIPSQLALEGNLTARPREVNLIILFGLIALLSIPLAIDPQTSLDVLRNNIATNIIIFIVMVNAARSKGRLNILFLLALAISCVLSVKAFNEYRAGHFSSEGYRVDGEGNAAFGNTNDLAIFLVIALPIAVALSLATRNIFLKIAYIACALLNLIVMVVTFSRGAFLGMIGVGLTLLWKLSYRNRYAAIGAFALFGGAFLLVAPGNYWLRIASIFSSGLDPNGSSTLRSIHLVQSFWTSLRHPFFGIGIDNFKFVSIRSQVTHNAYTQVSSEMGLAAVILYAMFIVAPLRRLRSIEQACIGKSREQRYYYYLSVGLQASLIGYMISSTFLSVAHYWFIYHLVGYTVILRRIYQSETGHIVEPAGEENSPLNGMTAETVAVA